MRDCNSDDVILVAVSPVERPDRPTGAREILNRINEISFNAGLLKELRMIALLRQVADVGNCEGARWASKRIHLVRNDLATVLDSSSKMSAEWAFLEMLHKEGRRVAESFLAQDGANLGKRSSIDLNVLLEGVSMGLLGMLVGLGLLMYLSYRGWSVLLLAPAAALVVAAFSGEPLLALDLDLHVGRRRIHLPVLPAVPARRAVRKADGGQRLGRAIAAFMTAKLGTRRAMLAVVLSGALVTYGGVSLFVAIFVLVPMAAVLFRGAGIPRRLMPPALALGTMTFTMSAMPGTPSIQNAIPMPFFGTTPFAAAGPDRLGDHAGVRPVVAGPRRTSRAAGGRRLRRVGRPTPAWWPRTRSCAPIRPRRRMASRAAACRRRWLRSRRWRW